MPQISDEELRRLQRAESKLAALEAGGVDNWEWYDEFLEPWRKENELDELIDICVEDLNDILVDADVEQPAGIGSGYSIRVEPRAVRQYLSSFLAAAKKIENGEV